MSLVTVSTKRKRIYPRKFDHDEARKLHVVDGVGITELARRYGVSYNGMRRVLDAEFRKKLDALSVSYIMSGICSVCGGPRNRYHRSGLCRKCSNEKKQTRFRFNEWGEVAAIRCSTCREWKPPELFPSGKASRGYHQQCRTCQTKARQDYRERHKVPCVDCGKPALPPGEKGTSGAPFPRCRTCFYQSQKIR